MFFKKILACSAGLVVWIVSNATPFTNYSVTHIESDQLPQSSVFQVLQDRSGIWWIVTEGGLASFDGSSINTFHGYKQFQTFSKIRSICTDANNTIYAFDIQNTCYTIADKNIKKVYTQNVGIVFHPSLNNYLVELPDTFRQLIIPSIRITKNHTYYFNAKRKKIYSFFPFNSSRNNVATVSNFLPENVLFHLKYFDGEGQIFNIDTNYRVSYWDDANHSKKSEFMGDVLENPFLHKPYNTMQIKIVYANHTPYLIFGQTVYSLSVKNNKVYTKVFISGLPNSISISTIGIDTLNNSILLGTDADGLYLLKKKFFSVKSVGNETEFDNVFYGIVPFSKDWYYSAKGFLFNLYKNKQQSILQNNFHFISAYTNGKYVLFSANNDMLNIMPTTIPAKATPLYAIDGSIIEFYTDADNILWLATKKNIGKILSDSIAWENPNTDSSRSMPEFESFKFISKSKILFGTIQGLYIYDLNTKVNTKIPELGNNRVRNIIDDKDGCFWICTYGNGLYYFANDTYYHYNNEILFTPHTVLEDKNNYLWISTNNGLFRIKRDALVHFLLQKSTPPLYTIFYKNDGFETNEFNGGCHPCGYAVADSLFLLPSMDGVVYFNPLLVQTAYLKYPIHIDEIEVNSQLITNFSNLVLPANFQNAIFSVSTAYYGNAANLKLEYKIEGYDKDWQPIGTGNKIHLKGLPGGSYTLLVRKRTEDLQTAYVTTSLSFKVDTPVWKTWWFIIAVFVAIGLMLFYILRLNYKKLIKRKQELKEEVDKRTIELQESLEKLSQSNKDLTESTLFREQILSFGLHDIRTPLKYVSRISENVFKNYKKIPPEILHEQLKELHESTVQFTSFSEGFLQWLNTHSNKFYLTTKLIFLEKTIGNVFAIYNEIAKEKGIQLKNQVIKTACLITDETILSIIIRNIIDNAIKYTEDGSITASAVQDGNTIITISDTGMGMSNDAILRIKGNIEERGKSTNGGLGMLIVHDMLLLLNGSLEIESELGTGTKIIITLQTK